MTLAGIPDSVRFGNGYQNVSSTLLTLYDTTGRKNLYLDANYLPPSTTSSSAMR